MGCDVGYGYLHRIPISSSPTSKFPQSEIPTIALPSTSSANHHDAHSHTHSNSHSHSTSNQQHLEKDTTLHQVRPVQSFENINLMASTKSDTMNSSSSASKEEHTVGNSGFGEIPENHVPFNTLNSTINHSSQNEPKEVKDAQQLFNSGANMNRNNSFPPNSTIPDATTSSSSFDSNSNHISPPPTFFTGNITQTQGGAVPLFGNKQGISRSAARFPAVNSTVPQPIPSNLFGNPEQHSQTPVTTSLHTSSISTSTSAITSLPVPSLSLSSPSSSSASSSLPASLVPSSVYSNTGSMNTGNISHPSQPHDDGFFTNKIQLAPVSTDISSPVVNDKIQSKLDLPVGFDEDTFL